MPRRRMRKVQVGKTPRKSTTGRKPTPEELQQLLAGGTWRLTPKRKSPGRAVTVFPFLRAVGGRARAKPHAARARRRGSWFGGFFELFGGPTRRRSARVLPFKKKTVRRG